MTLSSPGASDAFPTLGALNNSVAGQNGTLAFWANHSLDGLTDPNNVNSPLSPYSQLNIGNFLTGTCGTGNALVGSCPQGIFDGMVTPNLDPSTLSFFANGIDPVNSFYFTRDGSSAYTIDADLVYTANTVQFGWYDVSNPGTLNPIFSGMSQNQSLPSDWSLSNIPFGDNYGFYAVVNYGNGYLATYYTQSQMDSFTPTASFAQVLGNDSGKQHFALFQSGQNFDLALEDGVGTAGYEGMGDYQDGVFSIDVATTIPEPSTFAFAALALAGALAGRRHLRKRT